jgi:lipoprotein-anchoring transpeptidase ErfK/SrfK
VLVMKEMHYSRKYDNAPMPFSIFFTNNGHAIHATNAVRYLGRVASHGCVRLAPRNAKTLYQLVKAAGGRATIKIVG